MRKETTDQAGHLVTSASEYMVNQNQLAERIPAH